MTLAQWEYSEDRVFRTGCPRLCVLGFKYLAALTRRTTVTTVGTGLPNHFLHQATWFHFLNLPFPHFCVVYWFISVWRLWLFNFFSLFVLSCVHAFCTLYLFSFHHEDHAHDLLCLLLSTYSAASSSSLRTFLTLKFLSEEFIKTAYSPPLVDITHFQLVSEQGTPLFCVILV